MACFAQETAPRTAPPAAATPFTSAARLPANRAVATIEPKEGSTVPVAVWNISRYDEVGLDYYEGFPVLYNKLDFQVEMTDGSVITAMAYVMNPGRDFGKPSERNTSPLYPRATTTLELALRGFSPLSSVA